MRFGRMARSYGEEAVVQREVAAWLAEWIEADVSGMDCLEFGAGPGVFTRHLAGRRPRKLWATDIAAEMVELGRERVPEARWQVADAWRFRGLAVDRVYSSSLLQWAGDAAAVLGRWRDLMPGGGRLLLSLFVEGSMRELEAVCPSLCAFRWRSAEQMVEGLEAAGFEVLRQGVWEREERYPNALECLRSLHAIGAVQAGRVGAAKLRPMLKRIDERYRDLGYVPLSWRSLRVEASTGGG